MKASSNSFTETLINWYSAVKRDLPWRSTRDPYKIWLSEIILQQTRVDQGLPYYEKFVSSYPTVQDLAKASDRDVMKTWEGLGYYSRARNLHATAKHVADDLGGIFPDNYHELLKLKGVGPYTAAAIASIVFNEASPVLDGNVFRFVARYFGVEKEISDQKNRKYYIEILESLIPSSNPGTFNQAMMEFGATICSPAPKCEKCVFRDSCFARTHQKIEDLPVKKKKVKVTEQFIAYAILYHNDRYLLRKREDSIWTGLYEFHSQTDQSPIDDRNSLGELMVYDPEITESYDAVKHLLTHRKLWVSFRHVQLKNRDILEQVAKELGLTSYSRKEVLTLPLPKVIVNHLQRVNF